MWLRLVREFPTSDYVQAAFVSFGDYFVAQGDLEAAEQFYERALQFEGGRWLAYAHDRHAWALAQVGDRRALTELALVAGALGASPPQLGASAIRVAANGDQSALSATLACHATP